MKFKLLVTTVVFILILLLGSKGVASVAEGTSFRQQLIELVSLRDAGVISDHEYRSQKSHVLRAMMH
jgi:hypothetical protein